MVAFSLNTSMIKDYFCQQKFDWVEVRLYDGYVASCCQASPDKLSSYQITQKPLGFFNYDAILKERSMMLANQRVPGCESCWMLEDQGLSSRRLDMKSTERIYDHIESVPKTINLMLSNTCNQTCVYCCKNFSNSWLMDIVKNGDYQVNEAMHQLSNNDRIMMKLSQKDLYKSKLVQLILDQVSSCADQTKIIITGGEPFLDNHLEYIVDKIKHAQSIDIYTGLTVNNKRLDKVCQGLAKIRPDIKIVLSVENIGRLHEFNRYGSSWEAWQENYHTVKSYFGCSSNTVISNLTIFGLCDFLKAYPDMKKNFSTLVDPGFLSVNLLDPDSKEKIILELREFFETDKIIEHIRQKVDIAQIPKLAKYVNEFAQRRSLDLTVFPKSFLDWMSDHLVDQ